jgi:hypothetical protein
MLSLKRQSLLKSLSRKDNLMLTRSIVTRIFLLIILCLLMAMRILAQGQPKFRLPSTEITIQQVLKEIKNQSKLDFSYGDNLPLQQKIKFDALDVSLADVLRKIRSATGFTHKVSGNKIIFLPPARKHTVSGYLRDLESGESLIGANIYMLPDLRGCTSNTYGYFSLVLPSDSALLIFSYVGYETNYAKLLMDHDTILSIYLKPNILKEVVISGKERLQDLTAMSTMEMQVQQIKSLPAMGGEVDVMKSLQLLPGVQSGVEGSSGLYVRGGSPDQNLILLDGVPVYNASHLYGFFSVFNSDAINHVELIKGGFPARYGGRLSSVVNISMKEGNQQEFHGEGAIGLVSSKLTLEGPIKKNRTSFILSARRTFADLFVRPLIRLNTNGKEDQSYYFYDLNVKLNHQINRKNRLYLSAYTGSDRVIKSTKTKVDGDTLHYRKFDYYNLGWGNLTTALRWNSIITPKLFSNLTMTFSQYKLGTETEIDKNVTTPSYHTHDWFKNQYQSGIRDIALKEDVDLITGSSHNVKTGVYAIAHYFSPGALTYKVGDGDSTRGSYNINTFEYGGYVEDDITVNPRFKMNLGFHYSSFCVEKRTFGALQPRMALRYLLSDKVALKISYVQMQQYIHLLTNVGVGLQTDLWVPATKIAQPEKSWQTAFGMTYVPGSQYELTFETYYKSMAGLIEYKNGASYMTVDNDWQQKIEIGNGESYGGEIFLRKKEGKWTGWVGYTLAWAYRKFEHIDDGKKFPFKYDRRHDLETVLMYNWSKAVDFAVTWMYGSGYPASLPTSQYPISSGTANIGDFYTYYYPSRNNFRMRDFHRMDITVSFRKQKRWGERKWVFGLYNAYNRKNPYYLAIKPDPYGGNSKVIQYSLFPIIPAVSYAFKF